MPLHSHLHAGAGERAKGGLRARAGGLGLVAAGGAHLDVKGGDTQLLQNRETTPTTRNTICTFRQKPAKHRTGVELSDTWVLLDVSHACSTMSLQVSTVLLEIASKFFKASGERQQTQIPACYTPFLSYVDSAHA